MARPLFRPDPGWLWLIAGLVIVFVATVVPAQLALERDRAALRQLQAAETRTFELLAAHDRFLADLREGHPPLLRRLAASNLNRMPADHEAVLLAESIDDHPIRWLEASVPPSSVERELRAGSLLETLVSGRGRLWIVGVGVLCLFVGLMLGPMRGRFVQTRPGGSSPIEPASQDRPESRQPPDDPSRWRPVAEQSIAFAGGSLAAPELPAATKPVVDEEIEGVTTAEAYDDAEFEDAADDAEVEDAAEEELEEDEDDAEVEDAAEEELEEDEDDAEVEDAAEEELEEDEDDAEVEDAAEEELEEDEDEEDKDTEEELEDDEEEDAEVEDAAEDELEEDEDEEDEDDAEVEDAEVEDAAEEELEEDEDEEDEDDAEEELEEDEDEEDEEEDAAEEASRDRSSSRLVTRDEIRDLLAPAEEATDEVAHEESVPLSEFVVDTEERDEWVEDDAETVWR